ncbi:MAG: prepilin-type N-terminal cleavage/methylation domain-containing protein [Verrucomicrobia bacterium]|nr:prepilin-type N-terminal cleavage/methylation domain-containing protein [Verrucomicrobiota bacterium]
MRPHRAALYRRVAFGRASIVPARRNGGSAAECNSAIEQIESRRYAGQERRPPQLGFTLLELLVVVAVMAILCALLVPTLSRGKTSAARIKCVSNLRQLGLAAQMYWDDNGGKAFPWRGAALNGGQVYWFGWLENGPEGERRFDATQGALYPYLAGRGIEVCPSFNYLSPHLKLKATGASYGYGYNLHLAAPPDKPPVNLEKLPRPAELVFLADAAQVNTFQVPASPVRPMLEEFYYINTNEATVHFRHAKAANAVFCDGHVAPEKPLEGSLDRRLPKQFIGRLRVAILIVEN